ncbi:caspase family protein [bacterium]|nr:caspase family protein [bacterium]
MKKEPRIALVIGNSNYEGHPSEVQTQNARKVRSFLEKSGFYVYYGENLDKRNFIHLLRKFNRKMYPGSVGLVYFSGHIVQTKGNNYLIPVESGIHEEKVIPRQGISLKFIYTGMQKAHNRLNIVILDNGNTVPFDSLSAMQETLAPIQYFDDFSTFTASYPGTINHSDTFTQDFLMFAEHKGLELRELRSELTCHRQQNKQPKPHIDLARDRPFYFTLPALLPPVDEPVSARSIDSTSIEKSGEEMAKAPSQKDNGFKAKAAEATQKMREEARKAQDAKANKAQAKNTSIETVSETIETANDAFVPPSSTQPEEKIQSDGIGITVLEPGSTSKALTEKPIDEE